MPFPLLSLLIWLPIAGGVLLFAIGGDKRPHTARWVALWVSLLCLAFCIPLWQGFDPALSELQWVEHKPWFPPLDIFYGLGVDGFSLPLIALTCLLTPLVVLAAWQTVTHKVAHYLAAFLLLQGFVCGVFAATDAMLFYIFWEAMLIPMFLIIGIWGGPRRTYAAVKFFLYTFLGSVFLLVALIYLHYQAQKLGIDHPFSIAAFQAVPLSLRAQHWLFLAFLLAFAVKIPMVPLHTWLPDAHVEAPTGGSVILAAILLKMGGYGLLRFMLPIVPDASREWQGGVIVLSLIAIVYIGLIAIVQKDMKKLIAYSSIAHMGFVTLGIFIAFHLLNQGTQDSALLGIEGAYAQMISHGFISGALFFCVGVLYDRAHSRNIADYGGVVNTMPFFASFFVLFALANAGLPGTSGFVGEFLVILSSFQADPWYAFFAAMTLILAASYSLWMIKRVVFGPVVNETVARLHDLTLREWSVLTVLAVGVIGVGVWPLPLLKMSETASETLLAHIGKPKYAKGGETMLSEQTHIWKAR